MKPSTARSVVDWLFSDEEDDEPGYDPVHVAAAIVATLTAFGALYWLLWTLLVYEGGLFAKLAPAARVLFTSASLKDVGYEGPWDRGPFEGWAGNLGALLIGAVLAAALARIYKNRGSRPWK